MQSIETLPGKPVEANDSFIYDGKLTDSTLLSNTLLSAIARNVGGVALLALALWTRNPQVSLIGYIFAAILILTGIMQTFEWKSTRSKLARMPSNVSGHGIKVSPNGFVEIGTYTAQITDSSSTDLRASRATAHVRAVWNSQYVYSKPIEILVNIMRIQQRGWMVANVTLDGDHHALSFILNVNGYVYDKGGEESSAWISTRGQDTWLSRYDVASQFQLLSAILAPLKASGACTKLKLTFTETGTGTGPALGPGTGGGVAQVAAAKLNQNSVNDRLAKGLLPADCKISPDALNKYGYELCPNADPKRFRRW